MLKTGKDNRLRTMAKEFEERERTFLSQIIQGSTIPTLVVDRDHICTHWNKAMENLTGHPAEEVVGTSRQWIAFYTKPRPTMADLIIDELQEEIMKLYRRNCRKSALIEGAYEAEDFFPDKGETGKWIYFSAAPIKGPEGKIVGSIETIWDITQSKQLQHECESHIHQLSTLWLISSALSTSLDVEESTRIAVDKIIATLDVDSAGIYLKEESSDFRVAYSSGYSEGFYQTGSRVGPDGIVREVAREGKAIICEDITISNTLYREFTLNEGLKSAAYLPLVSREETFGVVGISSHTLLRFSDEDKDLLDLIGNRIALTIENARLHHQTKTFSQSLELKVQEKTKELEESYRELRKSEERYRTMFDADPNPIFIMDIKTFKILDINATALDCYGYSRDEFLTMFFSDLGYNKNTELVEELKSVSMNQSHFYPKRIHQRKGGDYFYVDVHINPVRFMERDSLIATTTDITENVEKEAQLIQAGKMATLGTMAAGMAHEINQPLNVIQVCADFFLKMLRKDKEISKLELTTVADEIRSNVQRAAGVINHMRDFARQSEAVGGELNINKPIRDVFKVLGQQLRVHQIEIGLDLDDNLPPILADHNRMEQIFINLVTNAMDTLDEKGRTGDQEWKKILKIRSFSEDGQVVVTVSDNGAGIPEDIIDRIFEPFFTTKDIGKGTGLGMSISYGIVKDYGGTINVRSKLGEGTTFELKFPIIT
ncbi:MAG: PAS domain S-box protein [Deltaproteobacteria bacterium]|nr:PAS domain S-box protein [Deltaproteobacteria bacterium]